MLDIGLVTKEEFLKKNEKILKKYTILIGKEQYIEGKLGNKEDLNKLDFRGIYVILENDKVLYIGSALPVTRTIKERLKEHLDGHKSHSCIIPYLMKSRNIKYKDKAKKLLESFDFMAFKYISLEYQLISETEGIINKSGKRK